MNEIKQSLTIDVTRCNEEEVREITKEITISIDKVIQESKAKVLAFTLSSK